MSLTVDKLRFRAAARRCGGWKGLEGEEEEEESGTAQRDVTGCQVRCLPASAHVQLWRKRSVLSFCCCNIIL